MTAYWIAHVTVTDAEAYAGYQKAASGVFDAFGGTFLARGGESLSVEGQPYARHVIIAFPDLAAAKACYASAQYAAARAHREGAADVHVTIVDGY